MNSPRDAAIWKDLFPSQQGGIIALPLCLALGILILQKNKQSLLWSMVLQSSQGSPASKLSPADDTDPTSRGLNPSAKTLKTEMVERENREHLSTDKKWGWHKGNVAYKGITGEVFIRAAGFQGP